MKASIKRRWVHALRSGEYKQSHGRLRGVIGVNEPLRPEHEEQGKVGYCCLGVLTDLYMIEHGLSWDGGDPREDYWIGSSAPDLPPEVREWAGLSSSDPTVRESTLAWHNDGEAGTDVVPPKPFEEIARLIEEHIPGSDA